MVNKKQKQIKQDFSLKQCMLNGKEASQTDEGQICLYLSLLIGIAPRL